MALNVESNVLNSFEHFSSKVSLWTVDLPKSPWDIVENSENLDTLCELVRNQYLKCLHQTLLDNLNIAEGYHKNHLYQIQQCVDICMVEMEKQALRQCMIASIYRESMSNMINEVKTCTKNSMLFMLLKHIFESKNHLTLWNKYFRNENMTKKLVSVDVNTEQKLNKTVSTQTEKWMDLDSNLSSNLLVNGTNTNSTNKFNLPSSPNNIKSQLSESNIFNDLNSLLRPSSGASSSSSDIFMEDNFKNNSIKSSNIQKDLKQENCTKNDMSSINALLRDLEDSPEYVQQSLKVEKHLLSLGLTTENHKFTDNLSVLPVQNYIKPNTIRPNKINEILMDKFKSERVAKTYELRKSLNDLPQELLIRLDKKFNDLFGNGHTFESDPLSEEEERIIAHKRIVKMVVEFMTPYYKAHRINRNLFKSLAKLISKNLMDRAYDPDEVTVARGVNEFFIGNRCIKTAEDIYQ